MGVLSFKEGGKFALVVTVKFNESELGAWSSHLLLLSQKIGIATLLQWRQGCDCAMHTGIRNWLINFVQLLQLLELMHAHVFETFLAVNWLMLVASIAANWLVQKASDAGGLPTC